MSNNVIHVNFGQKREPTITEELYEIQVANDRKREEDAKRIQQANAAIIAKYRKSHGSGPNNNK